MFVCALAFPSALFAQIASVAFEDSYAVYGPNIFSAATQMRYCEPYRVLVAYINGTDMLFIDELAPANDQSTLQVLRGVSIREFNAYEQSAEILSVSCRIGSDEALQVSGLAHSFHTDRDFEFSITVEDGLGSYSFESSELE